MDVNALTASAIATLMAVAWKLIGAIVLWLVGRWLIRFTGRLLGRMLLREHVDATLARYFQTGVGVTLNIALVVALLGFFGVETTSFAALLAAGGVAIGVAWGGLLANFAAGAFLVFLRPFKVGDFVSAGGVVGTVDAIGLFGTTINTPDNVLTIVGNNKVFSDTIQNFSANPYRRVDLTATINNAVDHHQRDRNPEGTAADDPQRARRARADRRRPAVHAGRPGAVRPAVLQQRQLLAGVLRHEPDGPRGVRRGGLPGAHARLHGHRHADGTDRNRGSLTRGPGRFDLVGARSRQDVAHRVIAFVARVLEHPVGGVAPQRKGRFPGPGPRLRVVDRDLVLHGVGARSA